MGAFEHKDITPEQVVDLAKIAVSSYPGEELSPDSGWVALTAEELEFEASPIDAAVFGTMQGTTFRTGINFGGIESLFRSFSGAAQVYRNGDQLAISIRGTDTDNTFSTIGDVASYPELFDFTYINGFEEFLNRVRDFAVSKEIPSENIFVTGHSLGAGAVNQLAVRGDLADGFFLQSKFFALASPIVSPLNVLNVAYDNDVVFAITDDLVFVDERKYPTATDNLLLIVLGDEKFDGSEGAVAHSAEGYTDGIENLVSSELYAETKQDDFLAIFSNDAFQFDGPNAITEVTEIERLFIVGNDGPNQFFTTNTADLIDGGNGVDYVDYTFAAQGIQASLGDASFLNSGGFAGSGKYFGVLDGSLFEDKFVSIEALIGSTHTDIVGGSSNNDIISLRAGNDIFVASGGEDTLEGGIGYDIIYFNSGIQSIEVNEPAGAANQLIIQKTFLDGANYEDRVSEIELVAHPVQQANTFTDSNQRQSSAAEITGGFVVTWISFDQVAGQTGSIIGRRFDSDGNPVSGEFLVSGDAPPIFGDTQVASTGDGGFAVVWQSRDTEGEKSPLKTFARLYDQNGSSKGKEFVVFENPETDDPAFDDLNFSAEQNQYSVSTLRDGNILVASNAGAGPYPTTVIQAQVIDFQTGMPLVAEDILVNNIPEELGLPMYQDPSTAALANGGFMISWTSNDGSGDGIFARFFDSTYAPTSGVVQLNSRGLNALGSQDESAITGLSSGGYVAVWHDEAAGTIVLEHVRGSGLAVNNEIIVNDQLSIPENADPDVVALADGGYLVTWTGGRPEGQSSVFAQQFDRFGERVGENFYVNLAREGVERAGDLLAFDNGNFLATWTGTVPSEEVFYRLFTVTEDSDSQTIRTDELNEFVWSETVISRDEAGERTEFTRTFDDGRVTEISYSDGVRSQQVTSDLEDAFAWLETIVKFDENGVRTESTRLFDDGRLSETTFEAGVRSRTQTTDEADEFVWSETVTNFDVGGTRTSSTRSFDDGRLSETSFEDGVRLQTTTTDVADEFVWKDTVVNYDEAGVQTDLTTTFDDGRVAEIEYQNGTRSLRTTTDLEDVLSWATRTDTFDTDGELAERTTIFDDGRVVTTSFGEDLL